MADLTQTPANVRAESDAVMFFGSAGATIAPGQPVYLDSAAGTYKLADADAAATADVKGIAVNYADSGDTLVICQSGSMDIGATLVTGVIYVVSNTAGNIMPSADLTSGEFSSILGIATTTSKLKLGLQVSGVAVV